jgi:DNA-binding CsgD family transcriptional regulator
MLTLSATEYDHVLSVLTDCADTRSVGEFRERLLESLAHRMGFTTTTFFVGSSFSTLWTDPEPLQKGKAIGMLRAYREHWYADDIFATAESARALLSTRVASIGELSRVPDGARRFMTDYLAPAGIRTGTALYLDVSGTERALVGIFGDDDLAKQKRDVAALQRLVVPLNAMSRALTRREQGETGSPADMLSPRHREVAFLVTEGMSNAAIAGQLHLSEDTVKKYVSTILATLRCRSRTQLALLLRR